MAKVLKPATAFLVLASIDFTRASCALNSDQTCLGIALDKAALIILIVGLGVGPCVLYAAIRLTWQLVQRRRRLRAERCKLEQGQLLLHNQDDTAQIASSPVLARRSHARSRSLALRRLILLEQDMVLAGRYPVRGPWNRRHLSSSISSALPTPLMNSFADSVLPSNPIDQSSESPPLHPSSSPLIGCPFSSPPTSLSPTEQPPMAASSRRPSLSIDPTGSHQSPVAERGNSSNETATQATAASLPSSFESPSSPPPPFSTRPPTIASITSSLPSFTSSDPLSFPSSLPHFDLHTLASVHLSPDRSQLRRDGDLDHRQELPPQYTAQPGL
ncbi:hypothetical protein BV22DRAFT_1131463 [Leucogyrophana mollusca]|uniref:Uncharacterized protein n=1 Tax=Leucogyrophana mollusca TaxID=85980 RepID=A0ACB8BC61_9AGAM|nr:hypothetical protein BV22DRAFT_1131463 [Leucogyrophana mollusca]